MIMNIGGILKELREEKGISQSQLCKELGFSNSTISKLESSRNKYPSVETVIKLADYFKVTVGQMVGTEPL